MINCRPLGCEAPASRLPIHRQKTLAAIRHTPTTTYLFTFQRAFLTSTEIGLQ
ncbi:MAG: hypothetical protein AABZ47_00535 [Planctomycetota bacterium]